MANEGIKAAISELHDKLGLKEQEIVDLKKAINVLLATMGEGPEFAEFQTDDPKRNQRIRPDQYFRKSITAAAFDYLKGKGSAASVEELIDVLKRGGCDLGASPLRNVKISLSKNARVFADVGNDTFGLWEFYGGTPRTKQGSESAPESAEEAEAASGSTEGV